MDKRYCDHIRRIENQLRQAQADKDLTQDEIRAIRARCEEIKKILSECTATNKSSQRG